jgi:hypothetical protein
MLRPNARWCRDCLGHSLLHTTRPSRLSPESMGEACVSRLRAPAEETVCQRLVPEHPAATRTPEHRYRETRCLDRS